MLAPLYAITKEVKSNPKQASCKKKLCSPATGKKYMKSKVAANDGRVMAKNLIMTIQVNLIPNPSEMWRRQYNFT